MQDYKELKNCLCCGESYLQSILDLGNQPLANNFHSNTKKITKYPLKLNVCKECWHCQLSIAVNPELMFTDYKYVSGTTNTLKEYFRWFANYVMTENCDTLAVLDIGCNDGSQLDEFKKHNVRTTIGIEPSKNLKDLASGKGHYICNQYFDKNFKFNFSFGPKDEDVLFDCIIAQNVFAHNSNPLEFLEKCARYLHPHIGTLYIQVSQVDMIKNNEFDTIYHEHISFFNINSMNTLIGRTKTLYLADVIKTPIHGNSYIFVIKKRPINVYRIDNLIYLERADGLYNIQTYIKYAENVQFIKDTLKSMIINYSGHRLVGYGAAAKGMVALNYFDIDLDYIIDDNPLKHGLYTPGSNIRIYSINKLEQEESESIIIIPLAWNFFDEIKMRIQDVRPTNALDKYIKYFPKVEMI